MPVSIFHPLFTGTCTKGHAALEVETTYTRARELCQQIGETPQLFPILLGLGRFYFARGELRTALELREQLLALAQNLQDPGLLARAHSMLGELLYFMGEFTQNRAHVEQAITLYDPLRHRSQIFLYGNDTGVGSRINVARALWTLGYPDQALNRLIEALTLAQELAHPFNLAMTLHVAAWIHQLRREEQVTQERAEALVTLSTEQGFALFTGLGIVLRGWALAEQGQVEEGIAQIRQGIAASLTIGAEIFRPHELTLLAEAYRKAGQPEQGLTVLAQALAAVDKNGERYHEAEMYRLKGELTLQKFQVSSSKFQVPPNPQPLTPKPKLKNVFGRPSRLPVSRARNR